MDARPCEFVTAEPALIVPPVESVSWKSTVVLATRLLLASRSTAVIVLTSFGAVVVIDVGLACSAICVGVVATKVSGRFAVTVCAGLLPGTVALAVIVAGPAVVELMSTVAVP